MEKQQIKARFFGMHIGCKISVSNVFGSGEYILLGVSTFNEDLLIATDVGGAFSSHATDCKLILKPLSEISDEDAIECARISKDLERSKKYTIEKTIMGGNIIVYPSGASHAFVKIDFKELSLAQADFLRSKNYCLPFMGIDPVWAGFAIIKETK